MRITVARVPGVGWSVEAVSERSDDIGDIPTAPEHVVRARADAQPTPTPAFFHEGVPPESGAEGLESQILLARARSRLLGWDDAPAQIGRYRVLDRLGAGGMGVVYAAHDEGLDRVVALKILRSELAPGSAGRQRLLREAQATARLAHPNVVHVFEVGQQGDQVFMAMELVRGETLRAWQTKAQRSWAEIVAMYREVGEGLVAAHAEAIVHRDFKPDNVLVGTDGRPQIVDFGLARASGEVDAPAELGRPSGSGPAWRDLDITGTGTVLGTPAYMAPEQLRRAKPDARCDQFSFCVALFEALYRQRPFTATTYEELADALEAGPTTGIADRRGVPEAVHAVVLRGLAHDPGDRFGSMRELLDALASARAPRPARARLGLGLAGAASIAALGWAIASRDSTAPAGEPPPAVEAAAVDSPWAEILAGSDLPELVPEPLPGDPTGVTVHRLANGLTLYLANRPEEPLVTMVLAIRAGATEEGAANPGLASLVRDSVSRGSAQVGTSDFAVEGPLLAWEHALIERLPDIHDPVARAHVLQTIAASEQASSAYEVPHELGDAAVALGGVPAMVLAGQGAVYSTRQPGNRVGAWLRLVGEVVQRPVFRGFLATTAFQLDMAGGLDQGDPGGRARDPVLASATGIHRGGEATLATLARVPLAAAKRFHHELYRPNNAALVVIGDITAEQALRLAEQELGSWEPAALPEPNVVDAPLPRRTVQEVRSPGGGALELVWPMPPSGTAAHLQLQQLEHVLGGSHGLVAALGDERAQGYGMTIGEARDFVVIAIPKPGESGDGLEPVVMASLQKIADGKVDDALWEAALAESTIERLSWARGSSSLASAIAGAYLSRQPWSRAVEALSIAPPSREEVMAATRLLLERPVIVTRGRDGEPPPVVVPQVPTLTPLPPVRERSAYVEALVAAPTTELEPRFLVAGSSYEETANGAGRVITARANGPLFWLTWIYPVGTAEDRWACDATRARLPAARIPGARISVLCTTADTRVSVMAPASRFAELVPQLSSWLEADTLELDPRFAEFSAHSRVMQRSASFLRMASTEAWALLGENAMDARLPREHELLTDAKRELPRALAAMQRYDADVLYVGPDPEALRAMLPAAKGLGAPGPLLRAYRRPARPEVIVMDDPSHHDVSVRAMVPWIAETAREQLVARIHVQLAVEAEAASRFPLDEDHIEHEVRWSRDAPLAIGVGFRVAPTELRAALDTAIASLRRRPGAEQLARLHHELGSEFRAHRAAPQHIPELVYGWPKDSADPRVAQWMALPSLGAPDVDAYFDRIDAMPAMFVVVGDLRTIDLDALAELGHVVRLDPAEVMLDPGQELRRDLSAILDE